MSDTNNVPTLRPDSRAAALVGQARHLISGLGYAAVSIGLVSAEHFASLEMAVGAVLLAIGHVWSWLDKMRGR